MSAKIYKYMRQKILGEKGTEIIRNMTSTLLTSLGIVNSERVNKKDGISAMVISYNESDWIELSLRSIADIVDEFVIIDSSDDETVKIIQNLKKELPINLIRQPLLGPKVARETGLKNINYKYVLIWDPDFIAKKELIDKINSFMNTSNKKYYHLVYWPWISLCGDLSHRCREKYHVEHWLFTYSKKLKYLWDGKIDFLYAPLYYKKVNLSPTPLGYHMNHVKRPERIALNKLFRESRYFSLKNEKGIDEAEKALKEKALELFGTTNLKEIGLKIMRDEIIGKPCFDYRELPNEVLKRAKELGIPFGSCT